MCQHSFYTIMLKSLIKTNRSYAAQVNKKQIVYPANESVLKYELNTKYK